MQKAVASIIIICILLFTVHVETFAAGYNAEDLYEEGMLYFENADYDRAFARFQISGDVKKYAPAQNMLGVCYRDGLGTGQDTTEAIRYFSLAADQEYPPAQENLLALEKKQAAEQKENSIMAMKTAIINMSNEQRAKNGLPALSIDSDLQLIADMRALELVSSPSHIRPDGSAWNTAFPDGVYYFIGENLCCSDEIMTEEEFASYCINKWMEVREDKENLLNPYYLVTAVGIVVSEEKIYAAQLFGTP